MFLCFPYQFCALFSSTTPGTPIENTKAKPYHFEPPEKLTDEKFSELKNVLNNWHALKDSKKAPFIDLAIDLAYNYKTKGLSVLPASGQQKNINIYYKYASFRVNNLNNEAKLNSDWLEPIFKELPLWLQYTYAYENKLDVNIASKILPTLFSEYLAQKISLLDVVSYLNVLNRYPPETLNLLPVLMFKLHTDIETLKERSTSQDQAMLYAAYSILRNLTYFDLDAQLTEQIPETIKLPIDIFDRAEVAKHLITGAYYLHLKNQKLSEPAEIVIKKLAYELMMILEPDGCLAQLGKNLKRVNYREALFYASEIFDSNDLRFVAQGGLRNDGTNKPLKNEIYIKESGYFASKSTWNILDIVPEYRIALKYQDGLGQDASQFTFDAINQEISFYGYSKPLIKVKLLGIKIDRNALTVNRKKEILIEKDEYVADEIEIGSVDAMKMKITYIRSLNAIIIDNKMADLKVEIKTYRSQVFNDYTDKEFKTVHQVSPLVFYSFTDEEKHKGDCVIKGSFTVDECNDSPIEHPVQGHFNKIVLSSVNHLILEAKPLLLVDMKNRRIYGDVRVHQIADLSYEKGEIKVKKSFTQLTVGPLRKAE